MDMRSRSTSSKLQMIYCKSRKTLNPALQRMLKAGWLESEMGLSAKNRPVRIFRVIEAGAKHLEAEISSFERMFAGITRVLAVVQS